MRIYKKKAISTTLALFISVTIIYILSSCSVVTDINVVTREDGSGTRTAFVEIFGIEEKYDNGDIKDKTTKEAIVTNKTDIMLATIAGDKNAIGYISIGSLNDTVKTLKIDGADPTEENIQNGSYEIARPFYIVTKEETTEIAKDFISFILSKKGQGVVSSMYIPVVDFPEEYKGNNLKGKIVIAGSSSITPIMEKLAEEYKRTNSNAIVEVHMSDSSSGITESLAGTCDIGMVSRELKESESGGLVETRIALDGIAIIVNKDNSINDYTKEAIRTIFTGEKTEW